VRTGVIVGSHCSGLPDDLADGQHLSPILFCRVLLKDLFVTHHAANQAFDRKLFSGGSPLR